MLKKLNFNIFGGLRKALNYLSKATKILLSLQSVQKHATALIDDLELIWDKPKITEE